MAEVSATIESLELRFLQSWMHRDADAIRSLAARDLMVMVGTKPPELLDRPSFVAAMQKGFRLTGFRLQEAVVRRHGRNAWFAAGAELEIMIDREEWKGQFLMNGLWRKARFRGWKLVERSLAPTAQEASFTHCIRQLQLWK